MQKERWDFLHNKDEKMKRILAALLLCLGFLPVFAQFELMDEIADIDEVLSNNAFQNASNRYTSMLLYFFPEQTTRMGMTLGNNQLNVRTPQQEKQAEQAFRAVAADLDFIEKKALTKSRQIDMELFDRAMQLQRNELTSDRLQKNPLYYAQAFDSIFDLYLRPGDNTRQRNNDALARIKALPNVAAQAKENLTNVSPLLAQQAMEKAYHALLSFDDVAEGMASSAADEYTASDIKAKTTAAKNAIGDLFKLFKTQVFQNADTDFRLGSDNFTKLLAQKYQIDTKPLFLSQALNTSFEKAQYDLWQALLPFKQEPQEEEITVIGPDGEETTQTVQREQTAPTYVPPTADQFYKIAQDYFPAPDTEEDVLSLVAGEVSKLAEYAFQGNIVYPLKEALVIKELPAYYAYSLPYLSIPADGFTAFYLRTPSGNALAKEATLKKDLNTPQRKVMISKQIFPGRYYQSKHAENLSKERNLYASPTLRNGWGAFATEIAQDYGFFTSAEELLAAAWDRYLDALKAVVDYRLQNKEYDYGDAWNFLVSEQGFPQEEAEAMLRELAVQPGQATSTIVGRNAIADVYNKYTPKLNNRFTHADLVNLFMKVGNVPPANLDAEIKREYKAWKKKK